MKIRVAPSILSADFSCLEREIRRVERAGADMLHIDVMDGHFVPNITVGPVVVKSIRKVTTLPLDVHLMIENPARYLDAFIRAGSDLITMHVEAITKAQLRAQSIKLKERGIKVGISLNPPTPISKIKGMLGYVDFVLVMSVNPGFGAQEFIPSVLPKIKKLRTLFKGDISVDGGVSDRVSASLIKAGANILASGSYVFKAKDIKKAIQKLRG